MTRHGKLTLSLIAAIVLIIALLPAAAAPVKAAGGVAVDIDNFPDDTFRSCVSESFDSDGDGVLGDAEIAAVTEIDVYNKGITSLTGVEHFTSLTSLDCRSNQLTSLDISQNTALTSLDCRYNQLTALDVSANTALEALYCSDNQLTALDVSANTALEALYCSDNQLTALDVSTNTALEALYCSGNQLAALDVSKNTALTSLVCYTNQLPSLDVSKNTALTVLSCSGNQFASLDVSKCPRLENLYCYNNQLTALDVSKCPMLRLLRCYGNRFTVLDIGACPYLSSIVAEQTWYGQYDDNYAVYIPDYTHLQHDKTIKVNIDLTIDEEHFPDETFRAYISDNFDTDGNGLLSPGENKAIKAVNVSDMEIGSLEGIVYLYKMQKLTCSGNALTSLDVRNNASLTELYCSDNQLTELTLNATHEAASLLDYTSTGLYKLECSDNQLTDLDVSKNTNLQILRCENNALTNLGMSQNLQLRTLYCNSNELTSLNVNSDYLNYLYCNDNELTSLDVAQATYLACQNNRLTGLDFTNCYVSTLHCENNELASIIFGHPESLEEFYCQNNSLTSLDLSNANDLTKLSCYNNNIDTLDIRSCEHLVDAWVKGTPGENFYGYCSAFYNGYSLDMDLNTVVNTGLIPVVATHPQPQTVAAGYVAIFSIEAKDASGYQWQYSTDGVNWTNCRSASYDQDMFHFIASVSLNDRLYRCVITNCTGSATSEPATLTVVGIKTQPKAQTVAVGAQATFKVVATGATSYQWQWSADGTTWKNCSSTGYDKATFSFKASTALNNRQYRCQIRNGSITVTSNAAKLTLATESKPTITTQPKGQTVAAGQKATFSVVATGATGYQWQYWNGSAWKNCSSTGYNTNTFSFTASTSLNGRIYRCVVSNSTGSVNSSNAKLTVTSAVTKPTITTQPTNKTVTSGTSVTFKVVASGSSLTYQWQWSADNGKTWKNCSSTGYNTASFSFKASAALNGRMYRCVVKNSAGSVTSTGAKLTVSDVKPAITVQPTNQSVTAGTKVSFSVIAAGSGLKYQWQWSADGTTWTNCKSTGYNTATFTFTASASLNNRQYRCVVSNSYGSVTSSAGKLTVK